MASPMPGIATSQIELTTKPGATIAYTFIPPKDSKSVGQPLLIFLNGLGLPAASWLPTISTLTQSTTQPPILSYDRYGQGLTTNKDPSDATAPDPQHPHDCMDVVKDLHQLLTQLRSLHNLGPFLDEGGIFFVANSIGCALARLYAQTYPGTVSALLLLDSVLANSDFVSFMPNPDAADFKEKYAKLPEGVTEENIRESRVTFEKIFSPYRGVMGKAEGLSRKTLPGLLPDADGPKIEGFGDKGPFVTVVGHGFETFAQETNKQMKVPMPITLNYVNPYWNEYNEGLAKLTSPDRSKGPFQAEKCGHFIQKDDPELVAREISEMLEKLATDRAN